MAGDDSKEVLNSMSDNDEQEDPNDYTKGGYHPVKIFDVFNNRYHIIRKLGWGHFSTVWLCWDLKLKRFVALKVVKSATHYTETALDEIKLLRNVRESDPNDPHCNKVVQLLDDFRINGTNGSHVCMVFEVLGHNLLKLIIRSNYEGIPLQNVKSIIKQVLQGLEYLHTKCQIIHTDIKPENILIEVDENYIRRLAFEATMWHKQGIRLPQSLISTAPKEQLEPIPGKKISKNKKRKLKKRVQKQQQLLEIQLQEELLERCPEDSERSEIPEGNGICAIKEEYDDEMMKWTESKDDEVSSKSIKGKKKPHPDRPEIPEGKLDTWKQALNEMGLNMKIDPKNNEASSKSSKDKNKKVLETGKNSNRGNNDNNVHQSNKLLEATPPNTKSARSRNAAPINAKQTSEGKNTNRNKKKKLKKRAKKQQEPRKQASHENQAGDDQSMISEDSQNVNESSTNRSGIEADDDEKDEEVIHDITSGDDAQVAPKEDNKRRYQVSENSSRSNSNDSGRLICIGNNSLPKEILNLDEDNQKLANQMPDPAQEVCDINVKIADLGNACWIDHHFTEDIQTRQYRCLEVILGAGYSTPADIWSTACMAFELATGDYLFEPHPAREYSRDEDHLAHIIELLGDIPRHLALGGVYSKEFFNRKGFLRNILALKPWGLYEVLTEKYKWEPQIAQEFADFLKPMLEYDPEKRAKASDCLAHPFLADCDTLDL
ncbi:SR splicing factor protein kinase isoform X2 [Brevipalpus obovatus]|uniref:SR splicing factor protein kinase isoform X2 n=1 Tax=Brevipalpus obovatus TaxID=246614 RepID=UPI003D9F88CC